MLEPLESRLLLSSELGADGQLMIIGGAGDDDVTVYQHARVIVVEERVLHTSESISRFAAADVKGLYISTFAGNDRVRVKRLSIPAEIYGGFGDDSLSGSRGDDAIHGGPGADIIYGGPGNDSIYGEIGNDTLFGEAGHDLFDPGSGQDLAYGGSGHDQFYIEDGEQDIVFGASGVDAVQSSDFDDMAINVQSLHNSSQAFDAEQGILSIYGTIANDNIRIQMKKDVMLVRQGPNVLRVGLGQVQRINIDGSDGNDRIIVNVNIPCEIHGGNGNDTIVGSFASDALFGEGGNDYINGRGGDDIIMDEGGNNRLFGGDGDDQMYARNRETQTIGKREVTTGWDFVDGGAGTDSATVDTFDRVRNVESVDAA